MNDLISRQAALDALDVLCQEHRYRIHGKSETYSQYNEAWQDALDRAEGAIGNLPSAQPERKKGKWIYGEDEYGIDGYHCDKCGFFVPWDYAHTFINYIEDYNFCPNCGADMRGEQDDENRSNSNAQTDTRARGMEAQKSVTALFAEGI